VSPKKKKYMILLLSLQGILELFFPSLL
jgi:hypothetical protein